MKPIEIIAQDLFDKVRSRFSNLQMGDDGGAVTANPPDARFFDFDFVIEGNNLGRVSISINNTGNLKIFFSQGITEDADDATQTLWYDFLKEMRFFAKRRLMRFDTRDITKDNLDKTDFQYLAQTGPKDNNMNESQMFGNSTKSSKRKVGDTLLIVRHEGAIDPTVQGARSRKIKNIFIQNAEGERFKLPMAWLPLGKALQRHVYHGGYPHDDAGQDMIETASQCHQLSNFYKHVSRKTPSMNPDALNIAEKVAAKLKSLRHHMESLAGQKYYEAWKESFAPAVKGDTVLDAATMETYKDTFTVKGFDESLAEAFPLIHAIMQEEAEVDLTALVSEAKEDDCTECGMPESQCECSEGSTTEDFDAFESWADAVVEGTVAPDVMMQLKDLMAGDLQLGASGELISTLQGIGLDDKVAGDLFDVLEKMNPNSESDLIKQIIISELEKVDPAASEELMAAAQGPQQAQTQPAPQLPAPEAGAEVPQEEPAMAETVKGQDVADKSYLKTAGKKPGVISKAVDTAKQAGKWLAGKGGPGKEGPTYESQGFDRDTFHHWMADAAERIARGEFKDAHEVAADLENHMMGAIDPDTADRIAQRLFGHDAIAQHRVKPTSDIELPKDVDGEDDDADFLNKLRGQARSGSIKVGADTGEKDEDSIDPEVDPDSQLIEPEEETPKKGTPEEIAKSIIGFFNREDGTWTKGRPGIVAHVAREFGDEAAELAKQLIIKLSKDTDQHHKDIEEMRRLSGMPVVEADKKSMSRAAKGNEKYGKDGMKELAKAGREGASKKKLDTIRDKHDNYKK